MFQQNIQGKVQFEGSEQSELHSYMTQMLKLSDKEFKTTIINTLRDLMEKVDHVQDQMGNVSNKMETPRKKEKSKGKTRNKSIVTEMKNAIDGSSEDLTRLRRESGRLKRS